MTTVWREFWISVFTSLFQSSERKIIYLWMSLCLLIEKKKKDCLCDIIKERRISQLWSFQRKEGNASSRRVSWCALDGWTDCGTLLSFPRLGYPSLISQAWQPCLRLLISSQGWLGALCCPVFRFVQLVSHKKTLGAVTLEWSLNRSPILKITWELTESRVIA